MPQSFLFTGAPTSEPISPDGVTPAPTASEEEDPSESAITSSPTAVSPVDVTPAIEENETAAPTPSPPAGGSSEGEGEVDAQGQGEGEVDIQGQGGNPSVPPPPAGAGGNAVPSAGGEGGEVIPEATPDAESETPATTPEASLEPVEPVAPAAETPVATPAPSDGTAVPVTTILLELAGSVAQKVQATTVIVAEVEKVLKTKATFTSTRRALTGAASSTPFFPAAVRRALQETTTAGALCASEETPKSSVTITLANYDDTVRALSFPYLLPLWVINSMYVGAQKGWLETYLFSLVSPSFSSLPFSSKAHVSSILLSL